MEFAARSSVLGRQVRISPICASSLLQDNLIDTEGLKNSGLNRLRRLEFLNLSNNKIGDLKVLASILDDLPKLKTIIILGNPCYAGKVRDRQEYRVRLLGALKEDWLARIHPQSNQQ